MRNARVTAHRPPAGAPARGLWGRIVRMAAVAGTCGMVLFGLGISAAAGAEKATRHGLPCARGCVSGSMLTMSTGSADARAAGDSPPPTAAPASREYLLKAAFLYNFAKFTTWPAESFCDPQAPLRLCILGEDAFGAATASIEGKNIKQRPLAVIRIAHVSDAERCHILFVSTSEEERLRAILDDLHEQPILTISDMPNFARAGGTINLKTVEDQIRFDINVDAANAADLRLSSKLLRLGNIVSTGAM